MQKLKTLKITPFELMISDISQGFKGGDFRRKYYPSLDVKFYTLGTKSPQCVFHWEGLRATRSVAEGSFELFFEANREQIDQILFNILFAVLFAWHFAF